ncbi:MAG: PD-(D/E)XK nuclease family protein [Ignavibacteria bacterium]|nr:PD-(D/E)XK nuclease family protein [Ignavibacteria bacterium]
MTNVRMLPAGSDMLEGVLDALTSDGNNFEKNIVIFPGKRPGHFLHRRLARQRGAAFIPPKVYALGEFVDVLFRDQLGRDEPDLDALDAIGILFAMTGEGAALPGGEQFRTPGSFYPLGMRLFDELEELRGWDVAPAALANAAEEFGLQSIALLSRLYAPFHDAVRDRGRSTRALRGECVAEKIARVSFEPGTHIIIAGLSSANAHEVAVLRDLLSRQHVLLLLEAGPGIERLCLQLGIGMPPAALSAEAILPAALSLLAAPDTHAEVFGLASVIARARSSGPLDERTVVVLPAADALFPVMQHVLPVLGDDASNISLKYPVSRTPVASFLDALLTAIAAKNNGRYRAPEYLAFLLHPYTKNILLGRRASATRILVHAIEELFFAGSSATFFALHDVEAAERVFERAAVMNDRDEDAVTAEQMRTHLRDIHDRTLRAFEGIATLGDFARAVIAVLSFIADGSTARRHPYFQPFALKYMDAMARLEQSSLGAWTCSSIDEAAMFLRQYSAHIDHHFPGTPLEGLQVLGLSETRALRFDRVCILDANEGVLPGGSDVAALLPRAARERFGMPTSRDAARDTGYALHCLLAGAKEAHVFFIEGEDQPPSRFVEKMLWEAQRRDVGSGANAAHALKRQAQVRALPYRLLLDTPRPASVEKSAEVADALRTHTYSPTALNAYLQCPLRFYYSSVLRLREKTELTGDIDPAETGKVVHEILRDFHAAHRGEAPLKESARWERDMASIVDRACAAAFGAQLDGERHLIRVQIRRRMAAYVRDYLRPLLAGSVVRILDLETRIEGALHGFAFSGIIDRIDERDGRIVIMDYKTGGDTGADGISLDNLDPDDRDTWAGAIASLQLPVYALLYAAAKNMPPRDIRPVFLRLGLERVGLDCEHSFVADEATLERGYEMSVHVIRGLLNEIADPAVPFTAARDLSTACVHCGYTTLCGTQWVRKKW